MRNNLKIRSYSPVIGAIHRTLKGPHGESSITINADQPGVEVIFNKKTKNGKSNK